MIINTGMRTDIPAFYSKWFINRLKEGYVLVRNPYKHSFVTRYELNPAKVDLISFCTKNPKPMLKYMEYLNDYRQYWFVSITAYSSDIELNVPPIKDVIQSFISLSKIISKKCIAWRYDPIFIDKVYTLDKHINTFKEIAGLLSGYTETCIISFIDLYPKVIKLFPALKAVTDEEKAYLVPRLKTICDEYNIKLKSCAEGYELAEYGADVSGCFSKETLEKALNIDLDVPKNIGARKICPCLLSGDIGAYSSCPHLCKYCYANGEVKDVINNYKRHDPDSPFLIGGYEDGDIYNNSEQYSWLDHRISLF